MSENNLYKINLLFIFISTSCIFQSSYSLIVDESIHIVIITYAISLFVVLFQFILLIKLESIKLNTILNITKNNLIILFISICLTINILTCVLTLIHFFLAIHYKLPVLIIFFVFVFFILKIIIKSEFVLTFIIILFITFTLFNIFQMVKSVNKQYFFTNDSAYNDNFNKIIKHIKFKKKPDLHIFVYDALIPNYISNKYLDIKETSYSKVLKQEDVIIFKNSFADIPGTLSTLNSLLYLNIEEYLKLEEKHNFFNGISNSPLFSLFKYNGYKIATSSHRSRSKRGNFVDKDIGMTGFLYPSYCDLEGRIYKFRFFGPCIIPRYFFSDYVGSIKNISYLIEDNQPWLSINFIRYPRHIEPPFDFSKYKNKFLRNQKITKNLMESTIKKLKKSKKDSLILFLGDHGSYQKTFLQKLTYKDNLNLIIEDQQMVLIALLDQNNICSNIFLDAKFTFVTPIFILENILMCLTENINVISKKNDYSLFYD